MKLTATNPVAKTAVDPVNKPTVNQNPRKVSGESRARLLVGGVVLAVLCAAGAVMAVPSWRFRVLGAPAESTPVDQAKGSYEVKDEAVRMSDGVAVAAGLKTVVAEQTDEPVTLTLTGRTGVNLEKVTHVHAQFPGRIVEVGPQLGSWVKGGTESAGEGTRLCVIESTDLANAKSDYLKARVQAELDRDSLKRNEPLVKQGILSEKALLDAESAVRKSGADLEAARQRLLVFGLSDADLPALEQQQGRQRMLYEILAPRSGMITEKNVTQGELADPTLNLFTISDPSTLWVWGDVYERDLPRVRVGQAMKVYVSAEPGVARECVIDWISPVLDPSTRSVRIRGTIANPDKRLLADMYARLVLTVEAGKGSLVLPTECLVSNPGGDFLMVQETGAHGVIGFRRRKVGVEPLDSSRVRVVSGIVAGDRVLQRGVLGLATELEQN